MFPPGGPIEARSMSSATSHDSGRKLRRVRAEFEAAMRAGGRRRVEDLLAADPSLAADADATLELLYTEFVLREELGQSPGFDEYHARFPLLHDDLETLFQVHEMLRRDDPAGPASTESSEHARPALPVAIDGFEILGEIGRGGMGVVYMARQVRLGRIVALKVILSGSHAGKKERDRFRREVLAAGRLDHPNIVRVHEVGEHEGRPYCVMEHVGGGSLADRMAGVPWATADAADLVALVARAAHHAHERGIVHRDLKPANILIALEAGTPVPGGAPGVAEAGPGPLAPKIADFGLAKCLSGLEPGPTMTGDVLGTPAYMAPEQAEGDVRRLGAPTDVWALGVVLYELLTGRPPFRGDSTAETLKLVRHDEPINPRAVRPKLPRDLETICLRCLEKAPTARYATAALLADDLERWRRGEPILARPVSTPARALKWIRRHPSTALWLGLVAAVTAAGLAGSTWYALRAESRLRDADSARRSAQDARDATRAALYYQQVGRAFLEWQSCNQGGAEALLSSAATYDRGWEWKYVNDLCHDDLLTLEGHTIHVTALAYSPDGRTLASATGRWEGPAVGEVRLWDARTGRPRHTIATGMGPIRGLAYSPDGKRLAAASVAYRTALPVGISLWDAETGASLGAIDAGKAGAGKVTFSPDGRLIAAGGYRGAVRLWDARTLDAVAELGTHAGNVQGVAFRPDGLRLVSGGRDGTVRTWDVQARAPLRVISGLADIRAVAYSPDGRHVAGASYGSVVRVWDAETGATVATHDRHESPALALAFSPDGLSIASSDDSGMVHVREALDPIGRGYAIRGHTSGIQGLAYSPDGTRLATGGLDGVVRVRDAGQTQGYRALSEDLGPPTSRLAYSPDGRWLAAAAQRTDTGMTTIRDVRVWDVETGLVARTLVGHRDAVTDLAYNPDGTLLVSGSLDGTARLWEAATGRAAGILRTHRGPVSGVAFDPGGRRLATVGQDGTLRLWRARDAAVLKVLDVASGPLERVAFSPDGRLVAAAGRDGRIHLLDAATLDPREARDLHAAAVTGLAFSPDGRSVASCSEDGKAVIWEPSTSRLVRLETVDARAATGLAFSPDGRRLATSSRDWSIKLWDVRTGAEAFSLRPRRGEALCVAFSPDGRQLAAGLRAGDLIHLYDAGLDRAERSARAADEGAAARLSTLDAAQAARCWSAARFHADHLLADRHDDASLLLRRSIALDELGDHEAARRDLDHAARGPGSTDVTLFRLALHRLRAGDMAGYREACRLSLDRYADTTVPDTANLVAWTCALALDTEAALDRAIALAQRAVAAQPTFPNYRNTLATVLYRRGRFEESREHLRASVGLNGAGGSVEDWLVLAMSHARMDRPVEARRCLDGAARVLSLPDGRLPDRAPLWHDAETYKLFRREAEATLSAAGSNPGLINPVAPPDDATSPGPGRSAPPGP